MEGINPVSKIGKQSYAVLNNDTVAEVSENFTHMTENTADELLNEVNSSFSGSSKLPLNVRRSNRGRSSRYLPPREAGVLRMVARDKNVKDLAGAAAFSAPDLILLKAVIENVYDGLVLLDRNYKYTMLNKAAVDFYYMPEGIGKFGDSLAHTEYFDMEGNRLKKEFLPGVRALNGEKVEEFLMKVKRPDKTMYWSVSGRPIYNEAGNIGHALLCIHDNTEKVKYEQELKEQRDELESIIENMSEALAVVDKSGRYIRVNKKVKEYVQKSSSVGDFIDIVGKALDMGDKYYDEAGNIRSLADLPGVRVMKGEKIENERVVMKRGDDSFYFDFSATPILDDNGDVRLGIILSRNVTDHVKSEHALEESQAKLLRAEREKNEFLEKTLEMKDEFLSLISHEFRTPLNVINTAVQALNFIYADELPDKVKEYMRIIRQNTFRQLRLVNNLLDITRANAGRIKINKKNMDIVVLTKSITESIYQYASQKGIKVEFTSSFKKKVIGVDDEKYERILLNLLSNAIKFTSEGKLISISLRSKKGCICIEVSDNGIGIPPDKIDIIFERFGQVDSSLSRQAEGTGIGLSLVKKFVEALGGNISVKSKVGKGSTFTILLPDEKAEDVHGGMLMTDLSDNRLVQVTNVEFSDIYL